MLSSIAAGSSAPVGPPARPSGNQPETAAISSGMPETSPMITSACTSRTGSSRLPTRNSTRSASPEPPGVPRRDLDRLGREVHADRRGRRRAVAATNDRTPLPQPTSITVSPGSISSASAIVRLVCVGANTAGLSRDRERAGAALPLELGRDPAWSSMEPMVPGDGDDSQPPGHESDDGGSNAASSPGISRPCSTASASASADRGPRCVEPPMPVRVPADPARATRSSLDRPCAFPRMRWT